MNNKKGYLILFFCLTILFLEKSSISYAKDSSDLGGGKLEELYVSEQQSNTVKQIELERQDELKIFYNQIETDMTIQDSSVETANLSDTSESEKYEANYAGAYINNDILIVCLTEKDKNVKLKNSNVQYRIVEYSYNKLSKVKSKLASRYEKLYSKYEKQTKEFNLLDSITGIEIDEEKNHVVVNIIDLTEQKKELFNTLFGNIKCVEFQATESKFEDCANYQPGRGIYVITERNGSNITYANISIGYRAYSLTSNGTKYGFVTCGHGSKESVDSKVYSNTTFQTVVGKILKHKYSGSVDAAFVEIADGNVVGTTVKYSDSSGNTSPVDTIATRKYMTAVPKGSTIYKVGAVTYKTSGQVISTNCDFTVGGKTFSNLTKTEAYCKHGDSGGIVYTYFESKYCPAGLIKGKESVYSVYVKASEVINAMDVYPY